MSKLLDEKIEGRINAILDDLNYMFESVTQTKASVYTIKYLLQAKEEDYVIARNDRRE